MSVSAQDNPLDKIPTYYHLNRAGGAYVELDKILQMLLADYGQLRVGENPKMSFSEAKQALTELIDREVAAARLEVIDKVFELSPKNSFVNWKPTDAFNFYERLKKYEQELKKEPK